jgi:predicted dehydrogenase
MSLPSEPALGLNYRPVLPRRLDWRIGCVGAGFIMKDCHLLAYRNAGFCPVAIASRTPETAHAVAAQHAIPRVHDTISALLADPEIEILDVAVPPDAQPDLIRRAVEMGKGRLRGILAQKPLALSSTDARDLVKSCADAGIAFAVNQNMRFDQSVRAARDILTRGWIGEPVFASIDMRAIPHWMPWAEGLPSLSTFVMSIHHLDTFRYWLGTPERVLASTRPDPRTKFPHRDGINLYILEYANGARASSWDDVWTGPSKEGVAGDIGIRWRIEGTDGLMQGTIGWPKYPAREPSTLELSTRHQPDCWLRPRWADVWFPDAFVGTLAQLLVAVENGTEPEISARDNIETIALCEAVVTAATEHRVVRLSDVLGAA